MPHPATGRDSELGGLIHEMGKKVPEDKAGLHVHVQPLMLHQSNTRSVYSAPLSI